MLRIALLSLIVLVSCSSASLLRKAIVRRQSDQQYCQAIEGFDCRCSPQRVTCTTDRDIPQSLNVLPNERQKYPSVELLINGERDHNVNENTFEPVKHLFKPDAENMEFRIKFEKFTKLQLNSPGVFNRVFPDNAPATTRKYMAVEIYNPQVQPDDNVNLFANLNVDSLEIYVLYPPRGTFQQLFTGANIKSLRLTGGDIRSDVSQPFSGNIGRLELAKQAGQLTTQQFPIYPAHEMIINAFYVTDFKSDNPPNYSNVGELRIQSQESIPANAFQHYPNLHTLSVTTEKQIDPHAFDGLHKLEKLTIKDTKPSLELLNSLPNLKEFEGSLDKLDTREQCQFIEKLASGQLALQAIASGQQCTCESAYLDSATGRYPCDAQSCEQSSCNAIRNSYDASARTFKAPPAIRRLDGTDALRPREPKVYTGAYQVTRQDQDKAQQAAPQGGNEQSGDDRQGEDATQTGQQRKGGRTKSRTSTSTPGYDQQQNPDNQGQWQSGQTDHPYHPDHNQGEGGDGGQVADGNENQQDGGDSQNRPDGDGTGNQQEGDGSHAHHLAGDPNQSTETSAVDATDVPPSTKRRLGWLPIIIIIAVVAGLLLIGLIILLMRRRRTAAGYNPAATSEHGAAPARA